MAFKKLALGLALAFAACGGGSPTSPSGQAETFSWTVNGQSFAASSNGRGALRSGAFITLAGVNCGGGSGLNVSLSNINVGGTYSVGPSVVVSWTPDARTSSAANERWETRGTGGIGTGSGTITVTGISGDWISGSLNVVVAPGSSNQDKTPKTIQGTFELSFKERTIC